MMERPTSATHKPSSAASAVYRRQRPPCACTGSCTRSPTLRAPAPHPAPPPPAPPRRRLSWSGRDVPGGASSLAPASRSCGIESPSRRRRLLLGAIVLFLSLALLARRADQVVESGPNHRSPARAARAADMRRPAAGASCGYARLAAQLRAAATAAQQEAQTSLRADGVRGAVSCRYLGQRSGAGADEGFERNPSRWLVASGAWRSQTAVVYRWVRPSGRVQFQNLSLLPT